MNVFFYRTAKVALVAVLSGCVLSKTTVDERTPELKYSTVGMFAITVIDNRPFVLSGEEGETVEGIFRDGYGIPHAFVKMRDNADMRYSDRIGEILSKALYNTGATVKVIETAKGSSVADAISGMRNASSDHGLVINVIDSRIDAGGFKWSYFFNYEVIVLNSRGDIVSTRKYEGEDIDFQRELFHSGREKGKSYAFDAVLDLEYKKKFTEFLSDRETQATLASSQSVGTASAASQDDRDGVKRLAALKELLDNGLITHADYDAKKAEILKTL